MPSIFSRRRAGTPQRLSRRRFGQRLWGFSVRFAIAAGVLACVGAMGWGIWTLWRFVLGSGYFAVDDVSISGVEPRVEYQIRRRIRRDELDQGSLIALKTEAVRKSVERHPKVRSANVRKEYPNRLLVDVEQRQAVALAMHDPILAIDREGAVIEELSTRHPESLAYPFVSGPGLSGAKLGDRVSRPGLTRSLNLLSCLEIGSPALFRQVSEVHCDEKNNLTLVLKGGTEVRFAGASPAAKLPALEAFIEKMGPPENFAYIDLRFEGHIPSMPKREAAARALLERESASSAGR